MKKILVTGGAGYVGAVLVPKLLTKGYQVNVLDLYIYGENALDAVKSNQNLMQIKGDLRNQDLLKEALVECDTVIHLACISNDPSCDLDPELTKSINYDAFRPLLELSRESGVERFIFASSSSIYGVSEAPEVTEDHPRMSLTGYNKYKAKCEDILWEFNSPDFATTSIRPATVCGYSPRQRLDLTVNILTNHAVNKGTITVFGGKQKRPNLHIEDMTDLYLQLLEEPVEKVGGRVWNACYQNHTVLDIANIVKNVLESKNLVNHPIDIEITETDDIRSYHVSSEKIKKDLGFVARHTLEDAVLDLYKAFNNGKLTDSLNNIKYFNVKLMKYIDLT